MDGPPPVTKGAIAVTGVITLDGKPLDRATIQLTGVGAEPALGYRCSGVSDSSGNFSLTGDEGQTKGAPPGEYSFTISRLVGSDGAVIQLSETMPPAMAMGKGARESVPQRYTAINIAQPEKATIGPDGSLKLALVSQ